MKMHSERCRDECTRDVIFLFQWRSRRSSNHWMTEGVWLDRDEAQAFGAAHEYRWGKGCWQVYGIPAEGELAEMLRERDAEGVAR